MRKAASSFRAKRSSVERGISFCGVTLTNDEYKQEKQEGTLLRADWRHIVSRRRDECARSYRELPREQIPINGRKSKCCIVIRRYRAILPGEATLLVTTRGGAKCR